MCCKIAGGNSVQNARQNAEEEENRQHVKDLRVSDEEEIDNGQLNDIVGVGPHNADAHQAEDRLELPVRYPHDQGAPDATPHSQNERRGEKGPHENRSQEYPQYSHHQPNPHAKQGDGGQGDDIGKTESKPREGRWNEQLNAVDDDGYRHKGRDEGISSDLAHGVFAGKSRSSRATGERYLLTASTDGSSSPSIRMTTRFGRHTKVSPDLLMGPDLTQTL